MKITLPAITPGEWRLNQWGRVRNAREDSILQVYGDHSVTEAQADANAKAAAAVPEMLRSLKWIAARLARGGKSAVSDAVQQATAALLSAGAVIEP